MLVGYESLRCMHWGLGWCPMAHESRHTCAPKCTAAPAAPSWRPAGPASGTARLHTATTSAVLLLHPRTRTESCNASTHTRPRPPALVPAPHRLRSASPTRPPSCWWAAPTARPTRSTRWRRWRRRATRTCPSCAAATTPGSASSTTSWAAATSASTRSGTTGATRCVRRARAERVRHGTGRGRAVCACMGGPCAAVAWRAVSLAIAHPASPL